MNGYPVDGPSSHHRVYIHPMFCHKNQLQQEISVNIPVKLPITGSNRRHIRALLWTIWETQPCCSVVCWRLLSMVMPSRGRRIPCIKSTLGMRFGECQRLKNNWELRARPLSLWGLPFSTKMMGVAIQTTVIMGTLISLSNPMHIRLDKCCLPWLAALAVTNELCLDFDLIVIFLL